MTQMFDLPHAVQDIAASLLANAMERNWNGGNSKPAKEVAKEINEAFMALYEPNTNAIEVSENV